MTSMLGRLYPSCKLRPMVSRGAIALLLIVSIGCSANKTGRQAVAEVPKEPAQGQQTPTATEPAPAEPKATTPAVEEQKPSNSVPDSIKVGASAVTEKELGVNFYPGSKVSAKGSAHSVGKGQEVLISTRTTPDSPSKVAAYYKPLFINPSVFEGNMNMEAMASISSFLANGDAITILARQPEGEETTIVISRKKKS